MFVNIQYTRLGNDQLALTTILVTLKLTMVKNCLLLKSASVFLDEFLVRVQYVIATHKKCSALVIILVLEKLIF